MTITMQSSVIRGTIQAPASKSSMQRACAASLLAKGETVILNPGQSNDDKAALAVIAALGAKIEEGSDGSLKIRSEGVNAVADAVNCGESGLCIRMFAPIVALNKKRMTINGEGSLLGRPLDFFDKIFPQLGVEIDSNNGRLPLHLKGPLQPGNIEIDGSLSSQFLTGLLMAYAGSGARDVVIKVNNLSSKPYIDLTLKVMRDLGLPVPENRKYEEFYFGADDGCRFTGHPSTPLPSTPLPSTPLRTYTVEGDWSGGAFLLVAGALAGDIVVKGLDMHSTQADKAIMGALQDAGAIIKVEPDKIQIGAAELKAFQFDATDCPDLFPPLAALAAFSHGISELRGTQRLTHKESNRALTIQEELAKRGIAVELYGDVMRIQGKKEIGAGIADSHNDHRIAMMNAVIGLRAKGETILHNAQAVRKSYPHFFSDLKQINAAIQIPESSFAKSSKDGQL